MQPDTLDMDPDFWKEIWGKQPHPNEAQDQTVIYASTYGSSTLACAGRCSTSLIHCPKIVTGD